PVGTAGVACLVAGARALAGVAGAAWLTAAPWLPEGVAGPAGVAGEARTATGGGLGTLRGATSGWVGLPPRGATSACCRRQATCCTLCACSLACVRVPGSSFTVCTFFTFANCDAGTSTCLLLTVVLLTTVLLLTWVLFTLVTLLICVTLTFFWTTVTLFCTIV